MADPRLRRTVVAGVAALLLSACTGPATPSPTRPDTGGDVHGRVIDLSGAPVADADVTTVTGSSARSGADGAFTIAAPAGGDWVSVKHTGFLGRTRAGIPGDPLLVRLTPDDGETVSLQFGGDVMMGRRFFDADDDGRRSDGLIRDPDSVDEHADLLAPIAPLLRDADITEVNVESPVVADPYVDPTAARPQAVHPNKRFVFASGTGFPPALRKAGVDVVGLANNHQYDLLDPGLRATVDNLGAAGFAPGAGQFGLGADVDAAYRPAVVEAKGARFAFLGCTSITGGDGPVSYVAGPAKGGAAPCDPDRVARSVAAAKASGAVVVFSVHGGTEYDRTPADQVRSLTAVARRAGATIVANAHPHVVGGLDWDGSSLAAWSLGNLVFDQTVWPSFQSYTLTVHVRRGAVVRAYLEPLQVDGFVAHGARGAVADGIDRLVLGRSRGPFRVEDGAVELEVPGGPRWTTRQETVDGSPDGTIGELGGGWMLTDADPATVETGTDLLWSGDFEDDVLGSPAGSLWTRDGGTAVVPAPDRGRVYRLRRSAGDREAEVGTAEHRALLTNSGSTALRQLLKSGDDDGVAARPAGARPVARADVSLTGLVRLDPGARLEVQVSWFPGTRGPSSAQTVRLVEGGTLGRDWEPVRVDLPAPPDAVAVQVFFSLQPPGAGTGTVDAALDDVRLVEWAPPGAPSPGTATHVRTRAGGRIELSRVDTGLAAAPAPVTVLGSA